MHADYTGPYLGHMVLILIDAHSKWMEVHMTKLSTSLVTIEKMRSTFATLGLPEQLVTDSGPSFMSGESTVHEEQWSTPHHDIPLPSIIKWISREGCPDIQVMDEEAD